MDRADPVHGLAHPCEHDLDGDQDRDGKREQDASLSEPSGKGKDEENDRTEEDEVSEAGVEGEAVVECLRADELLCVLTLLVSELLRSVERAVCRSRDLRYDGHEQQCDPVAINRSHSLHVRSCRAPSRREPGSCGGMEALGGSVRS
jgi:hypothetical protein